MDDRQRVISLKLFSQAHGAIPIFSAHWKIHLFCTEINTPGTLLQEDIIAEQAGWLGEVSWEDFAAIADPECPR